MKKKILFVNSRLSGGGSERVMTLLANHFANNEDYEVKMVLIRDDIKEVYDLNSNVEKIRFKYNTSNKIMRGLKRIILLNKLFKEYNPDYIISFMIDVNIYTILAGFRFLDRIIVSERADPMKNRNFVHRFFEKNYYGRCKKVILQTNDVKEYFDNYKLLNTVVIPNPLNVEIPSYHGEREKRIVTVGRLTEQKNFELLIMAFKVFEEKNKGYILELYGDGELKEQLSELIKNLKLEDKVFLKGFQKDILIKIRKASIYVSSSDYEGISNSMLEALALGLPSICTDCPVGGARMVIHNNVNGILIPVRDKEALINAMNKIATDNSFSNHLSQNAVMVRERFSIENICKEWNKVLFN